MFQMPLAITHSPSSARGKGKDMTKPREFWVNENGKYETIAWGVPLITMRSALDRCVDELPLIHVREVSKEYDAIVAEMVATLCLYEGIAGHDCEESTTKWSAADMLLAKYEAFMKGREG